MKCSFAAAMAGTLWATVAHAQVLPSSGPESSIPVSPDDTPLVRRAFDDLISVTGLTAGTPGPYRPTASDRAGVLSAFPGKGLSE